MHLLLMPNSDRLLKDKPLITSDRIITEKEDKKHTLLIKGAKQEETGSVTVKATNDMGSVTGSAKLTVNSKNVLSHFNSIIFINKLEPILCLA